MLISIASFGQRFDDLTLVDTANGLDQMYIKKKGVTNVRRIELSHIKNYVLKNAGFDTTAIGVDSLSNLFWNINGNAGTDPAYNFIGTTDAKNLIIKTRSIERLNIDSVGNISSELNVDSFSFLLGNPFSGKFFLYGGKPSFGITNSFIARGMNLVNIQSNGNIELEADSSSVNANDINNSSTNSLYHSDSSMIINSGKDASISVVYENGRPSPGFYAFTNGNGNVIANMYLQNYHGNGVWGKDQKRFQCDSFGVGSIQWQDNLDSAGHEQFGTWATDGTSQIFTGVPYENHASDTGGVGSDRLILFHGDRLAYKISGTDKFSVDTMGLVSYAELDSVTIYALTPTKNATVYCSDCTGNGIVGRILSYIGSAWRRLSFN